MDTKYLSDKLLEVKSIQSYPDCVTACRDWLQASIDYVFEKQNTEKPKSASLLELLENVTFSSYVNDPDVIRSLDYVRIKGMNAMHGLSISKREADLSVNNVSYFLDFLISKELGKSTRKPQYMSEANTRKIYIDTYLKEAGWDIVSQDNVPVAGKASVEIEVDDMPNDSGVGYCDYVLYGRNGKPLAIVEAKKTSVDPGVGRHQVNLYAESMKAKYGYKPIMYYTNGYKTMLIDGLYPDRDVIAFHTIEELELMLLRRDRGDISDIVVNDEITNRPYQKIAITKICEHFNSMHRKGLIVMATGTGKTRVAISLVDILTRKENGWVKNVLFLADRTALVNQAKRNFSKLLPGMTVCELSGSGEKDYNAHLMFSTYQTMINYIDAEDKRFSTGRFDLIIIDEAHRSIFNRYGSIFRYFDCLLVGLTATPKNEVDSNTYKIFGCEAGVPNFDYSLEDAVQEKYLVGYNVINRTSKLIEEGIDYNSLTDEEKAQFEDYLVDGEDASSEKLLGSNLFRYLFNRDTCVKVLSELMTEGLRINGGETLGKTIIFAYNHRHADMIVQCFRDLYPDYPANTCQLVDYSVKYGDDLVKKFENDPEFRIAVSVDMLDTGIDVPEVLNLVFFKKVRSKIKFVQMIGRGTRLCPDVYGPNKDKTGFLIFDYCGNFEFFGMHPDEPKGNEQLTLSQRVFNINLEMLHDLQSYEYQSDEWCRKYYEELKTSLLGNVVKVKSHSERIQVRDNMEYVDKYKQIDIWVSITPVMIKEIRRHITPLIDSGLIGDPYAVSFDLKMYNIEHVLLSTQSLKGVTSHIKDVRLMSQYLLHEKASVPQVLAKASELKELMSEEFWLSATVAALEKKRIAVRDLMLYCKDSKQTKIDIDIKDVISDSEYVPGDTAIDIRTYREKVIDYLAEHSDSEVVRKITNLEPITASDLAELDKVLLHDLGTREDYENTTSIPNLAAFVRSLIGLSQEAVNEKFGAYLSGNSFNSVQQEFIRTIINYVRVNGDIELTDIANTEPFVSFNLLDLFGDQYPVVINIVNELHNSIVVPA